MVVPYSGSILASEVSTVPGSGGPAVRIGITAGTGQFGGTMRLLRSMGAIRAHEYKQKTFVGAGLSSFKALGRQCSETACPVPMGTVSTASLYYQTAMGKATTAAITAWGFPWTTGMVTITATDGFFPTLFQRTGFDNRTPLGQGTVQLVAPQLVKWDFPGRDAPWDRHTGAIGILQIRFVPEPSGWMMVAAGLGLLGVLYRVRTWRYRVSSAVRRVD